MDVLLLGMLLSGFIFISGAKNIKRAIGWSCLYIGLIWLIWLGYNL